MEWTTPAGFWWLLAAIPLAALFLLKSRPRPRLVSTLRFWQEVLPEGPASRWFHRWRDRAMLLLNLLLLLLLVAAIAEPKWRALTAVDANPGTQAGSSQPGPVDWVLVVDDSASLQASVGVTTRWQLLQREVRDFVAGAGGASAWSLLSTAGPTPVQLAWTESRREVDGAIARLRPLDVPGRLEETLRLARQIAGARPSGRIRVFSDGAGYASLPAELRESCEWTTVGQPAANTAITQFQVRRSFADPLAFEAWVEVAHFADQRRDVVVELLRDGELLDVVPVSLDAGAVWRQSWGQQARDGGVLTCRLMVDGKSLQDALAVDNEAHAVLDSRASVRVDLVTPGSVYLENVLRAIPWVELQVHREVPTTRTDDSLLVLHRTVPEQLPAGRCLFVDVRDSNNAWRSGPIMDDVELAPREDHESPWLRHVDLRDTQLAGVRELEFLAPATPLVKTLGDIPVYALLNHGQGTALVLNADLEQGDLAWRTAFPLLVTEALRQLQGEDPSYRAAIAAGEMLRVPIPSATASATIDDGPMSLLSPTGRRLPLALAGDEWLCGPLDEVGVWQREEKAKKADAAKQGEASDGPVGRLGVSRMFAVNLVDARESDLRAAAGPAAPVTAGAMGRLALWKWLAVAMLGVSSLEWFLHQRRYVGS